MFLKCQRNDGKMARSGNGRCRNGQPYSWNWHTRATCLMKQAKSLPHIKEKALGTTDLAHKQEQGLAKATRGSRQIRTGARSRSRDPEGGSRFCREGTWDMSRCGPTRSTCAWAMLRNQSNIRNKNCWSLFAPSWLQLHESIAPLQVSITVGMRHFQPCNGSS